MFLSPNLLNAVTYNSDPKIFIFELVEDALKTLDDKNLTQEEKNKSIEEIAKNNVDIRALRTLHPW